MNSNSFVVSFDLTADEVNALDTTPVSLGTFGESGVTSLVRVPVRAEIWRDAGTAYAVTHVPFPWDSDGTAPADDFDTKFAIESTIFPNNELWIRSADSRGERGPILFKIPIGILENSQKSGLVVMPESGQSYTGGTIKLTIEAGTTLASGTGGLHGRLYFDEFPLPI